MNAVTKHAPAPSMVLRPSNFPELLQFAKVAAESGMVPKDYIQKPAAVVIAVQMGSELGLAPMQSLQNIAVINGRPALWGDAMLGLCRQSELCEDVEERIEGEGDAMVAICIARRRGGKPIEARFSVGDAKKAGLFGKPGPWQQYTRRMLQLRARGFALRDAFPDVLRGLISAEEARDVPFEGTTIDASPEPARPDPAVYDAPSPPPANTPPKRTVRDMLRDKLALATTEEEVTAASVMPEVSMALARAPENVKAEINAMLAEAWGRVMKADPETGEIAPGVEIEGEAYASA